MEVEAPSRVKVLEARIDHLGAAITTFSDQISQFTGLLLPLMAKATKNAGQIEELDAGQIKELKAGRDVALAQQALLVAQQAEAKTELARITSGAAAHGGGSQPAESGWILKALEGLTLKVGEIAEKVDNVTRPLPKAVDDNLEKMLFAVLDKKAQDGTTRTPVGVSFFVRPRLAVTAFHVLSEHYSKTIANGATVYLSREAGLPDNWIAGNEETVDGPNLIKTTLVKFDAKEDWALMELATYTANIIPFEIAKVTEAKEGACQMLNFNIHLAGMDATTLSQITMARADYRNFSSRLLAYTCAAAYSGDSGGAVVVSKTGKVVAMHCELVNGMKVREPKVHKKSKVDVEEDLNDLNDVVSDLSSGLAQAVFEGIRLDYLEGQGYFAGY